MSSINRPVPPIALYSPPLQSHAPVSTHTSPLILSSCPDNTKLHFAPTPTPNFLFSQSVRQPGKDNANNINVGINGIINNGIINHNNSSGNGGVDMSIEDAVKNVLAFQYIQQQLEYAAASIVAAAAASTPNSTSTLSPGAALLSPPIVSSSSSSFSPVQNFSSSLVFPRSVSSSSYSSQPSSSSPLPSQPESLPPRSMSYSASTSTHAITSRSRSSAPFSSYFSSSPSPVPPTRSIKGSTNNNNNSSFLSPNYFSSTSPSPSVAAAATTTGNNNNNNLSFLSPNSFSSTSPSPSVAAAAATTGNNNNNASPGGFAFGSFSSSDNFLPDPDAFMSPMSMQQRKFAESQQQQFSSSFTSSSSFSSSASAIGKISHARTHTLESRGDHSPYPKPPLKRSFSSSSPFSSFSSTLSSSKVSISGIQIELEDDKIPSLLSMGIGQYTPDFDLTGEGDEEKRENDQEGQAEPFMLTFEEQHEQDEMDKMFLAAAQLPRSEESFFGPNSCILKTTANYYQADSEAVRTHIPCVMGDSNYNIIPHWASIKETVDRARLENNPSLLPEFINTDRKPVYTSSGIRRAAVLKCKLCARRSGFTGLTFDNFFTSIRSCSAVNTCYKGLNLLRPFKDAVCSRCMYFTLGIGNPKKTRPADIYNPLYNPSNNVGLSPFHKPYSKDPSTYSLPPPLPLQTP